MQAKTKRILKKSAKAGFNGVGSIILFLLRAIGTLILIFVLTGAIFALIFVSYARTNLMNNPDNEITLEDMKLDLSSTIYYKDSSTGQYKELVTLESSDNRVWVEYEDIPKDLEHAVVSIEDRRFYKHHGVDWYRTAGAFVNMFVGMKNTFGGSTITQQLIKNRTGDNEATVTRKLNEIFRAIEFERNYTKEDIMEWYLNIVYFGHRRYGIGAAADFYFGKEVKDLTLAEMASIVGITNNPSLYSPYVNRERNKTRQEIILHEMWTQGYITEQQYREAAAEELQFQPWKESNSTGVTVYSYYVDTVISDVLEYFKTSMGVTSDTAESLLYHGGYQIYACIDPEIQAKVDAVYTDLTQIPETTRTEKQLQSAIVIMDPYSGDIVALSGGVGEKTVARGLNRASGSLARRPTGSSIKPLSVYGPALDLNLITPETTLEDEADIKLKGTTWFPHNDDNQNSGVISIREGVIHSKNTIAAQVLDMLTPAYSYNFLTEKLRFTSLEEADNAYSPLAMGQETIGITPREMASGFTMFVNNGVYTQGRTFSAIYDSNGKLVCNNIPYSTAAISEAAAYWVNDMMKDAVMSGRGTGTGASLGGLMPVAGKTGTSSNYKDRWFVGSTPYYTAAVWCGYDRPEHIYNSGGNPSSILFRKVMTSIHENLEYKNFSKPSNTRLSPVIGVGQPVPFYIRGTVMHLDGTVEELYHEETYNLNDSSSGHTHKYASGRTVTVGAKEVEGYILVSEPKQDLLLDKNLVENCAEFIYTPIEPEVPEEVVIDPEDPENNPYDPLDPDAPFDPDAPIIDPDAPTEDPWTPVDPGTASEGQDAPVENPGDTPSDTPTEAGGDIE
ncbi:MAG: PBP1A family penicillin-binding protein [Oscillospiraceae bacterium]|nr:PBP1A family penicillin-binding protein [Oscillospiraceae bacterium]